MQLPSGGDRTIGAGNAGKMGGAGSYGGMSDAGSAGGGIVGCSITGRVGPSCAGSSADIAVVVARSAGCCD